MADYMVEIYPKVFKANTRQTVRFKMLKDIPNDDLLAIRIIPMEKHTVLHTPQCRINEERRYSPVELKSCGDGLYSAEYDFTVEQEYNVRIYYDDQLIAYGRLYALQEDLAALKPLKGDTHLHTCRSDGKGTPFEVSCDYRAAGYDFIAITDHHKFAPSLEAQAEVKELTDQFCVFRGEEVHNKSMGYFHIVNFNGKSSVNDIIETDDEYVDGEVQKILDTHDFAGISDRRNIAYRMFVADHIHKAGGLAIMAHPFWNTYGEYNMQTEEFVHHWQHGHFDALEVIAGCDSVGHGNNLQELLRCDMIAEGYRIPVVGASDAHSTQPILPNGASSRFNEQFTLVFAKDFEEIPAAIKAERSVAIDRRDDTNFRAIGQFRYAKYARFLMGNYYPPYAALCEEHAKALSEKDAEQIAKAEKQIDEFKNRFYAF